MNLISLKQKEKYKCSLALNLNPRESIEEIEWDKTGKCSEKIIILFKC